jgi:hypothetical protein
MQCDMLESTEVIFFIVFVENISASGFRTVEDVKARLIELRLAARQTSPSCGDLNLYECRDILLLQPLRELSNSRVHSF